MIARVMRVKDLTQLIRDEISVSGLAPGAPIMSAREFAEKYDTSVLTAHRAIKNLVDEGLLYRVKGSGSFIAEPKKESSVFTIGVSFPPHHGDPMAMYAAFDVYQDTITYQLRQAGHAVINYSYPDLTDSDYMASELQKLDGVIMSKGCIDPVTVVALEAAAIPVVAMQHEAVSVYPFHQVIPDMLPGFKQALKQLKSIGQTRFVIAANTGTEHQRCRINAIYQAAEQLNIPKEQFEEVLIDTKLGDSGRMSGQELGALLLANIGSTPMPAIITVSDFIAFGITDVILQKKLTLGDDVILVSYDDLEGDGFLPFNKPMISSISNYKKDLAHEAVVLLLESIQDQKKLTKIVRIPTTFTQRKSSTINT